MREEKIYIYIIYKKKRKSNKDIPNKILQGKAKMRRLRILKPLVTLGHPGCMKFQQNVGPSPHIEI